ncbi:MAG: hypothetical protein RIT14_476 [Pseudomonadota bacterium]
MRPRRIEITQSGATREALAVHALTVTAAAVLALFIAWSLAGHFVSLAELVSGI